MAIGVDEDGYREVIGAAEGMKEDGESWRNFMIWLRERGLDGVKLIVGDKCLGMCEAACAVFPDAKYQRCTVHFYRNVFSVTPRNKMSEVARMLKAIHAQESKECNEAGCNIAKMCTHSGIIHTDRDNVALNFHSSFTGNCSTVYALWTNHRIKSVTGGNDFYNRSCAYSYTIFMLENSTAANRTRDCQGVFMHELNHTIGAPDHYHEQTSLLDITTCLRCSSNGGNGLCSNVLCNSWNGTTNRPSSCIMNDSNIDISSDSILCDGCKADILSHLQNGSH